MVKYLLKLLVAAILGMAALWFGLPLLKRAAPAPYAQIASVLLGRPVRVAGTDRVAVGLGANAPDIGSLVEKATERVSPVRISGATPRPKDVEGRRVASIEPAEGAAEGGAVVTNFYASADDVPAGVEVVYIAEEDIPDPRRAKNADPGFGWGVVVTNSFCYDGSLRSIGKLSGGTVVAHMTKATRNGREWVSCKVLRDLEWQARTVVLETADVRLFDVPYKDTDRAQRDAIIDYCTAYGKLEALRAAAVPHRGRNPHEAEYRAAKAKHDALSKEIGELRQKERLSQRQDLPGGPEERQRVLSRLRELKGEQARDNAVFNPIRDRWVAWEQAHPQIDPSMVSTTPEMQEQMDAMARLKPVVEKICPGL